MNIKFKSHSPFLLSIDRVNKNYNKSHLDVKLFMLDKFSTELAEFRKIFGRGSLEIFYNRSRINTNLNLFDNPLPLFFVVCVKKYLKNQRNLWLSRMILYNSLLFFDLSPNLNLLNISLIKCANVSPTYNIHGNKM